ncbi:MAG: Crp/Fnr family transcriptional regulator [Beijerinckiaceae bacterium]
MLVESEALMSHAPLILEQLSEENRGRVVAIGQRREFAAGAPLWRQGDPHEGIYIIESGRVRSFYIGPSGREVTLAYWFPGNFVGGPDLFGDSLHMWCSSTDRPTRALYLPKAPLRKLTVGSAAIAVCLLDALAFKAKCYSAMAQMLGTRSAAERLQCLLVFLSTVHGMKGDDGVLIGASFTHADLAALIGATRQWVQVQIARLQERGIVRYNRGMLRILDVAALRADEATKHLSGRG